MDVDTALASLSDLVGGIIGTGNWFEITQDRVDAFADVTLDRQFIHIDPVRAADGPFGGTVAHGYLTLALLPYLADLQADRKLSVPHRSSVNYGLDNVRFVTPIRVPSNIRLVTTLKSASEKRPGVLNLVYGHKVEIEGEEKPALVADAITLLYL